jgi:hypothetical protein
MTLERRGRRPWLVWILFCGLTFLAKLGSSLRSLNVASTANVTCDPCDMSENFLWLEGATALAKGLMAASQLTELDLAGLISLFPVDHSDNLIGGEGSSGPMMRPPLHLEGVLHRNTDAFDWPPRTASSRRVANRFDRSERPDCMAEGASAIAGAIKRLTALKSLGLSRLRRRRDSDCSGNHLGAEAATAIAGGIKGLTSMELLDLSGLSTTWPV